VKDVRSVELNDIVVKDLDTARMAVRLGDSNGVGAVGDDFGLSWAKRHVEGINQTEPEWRLSFMSRVRRDHDVELAVCGLSASKTLTLLWFLLGTTRIHALLRCTNEIGRDANDNFDFPLQLTVIPRGFQRIVDGGFAASVQ